MKKLIVYTTLLASMTLIAGCGNRSEETSYNLENCIHEQSLSEIISEGKTTKAEILRYFGHNFEVVFDSLDREKWVYSLENATPWKRNMIPYNLFFMGFDLNTKELTLLFDKEGIVDRYFTHSYKRELESRVF